LFEHHIDFSPATSKFFSQLVEPPCGYRGTKRIETIFRSLTIHFGLDTRHNPPLLDQLNPVERDSHAKTP
jgi:hypothetical protein